MMNTICAINTAELSLKVILQYYAVLSLLLMPFMLVVLILLARHTSLLDKIDKIVDKILPEEKKDERGKEKNDEKETEIQDNQNVNLLSGVAVFQIKVGEKYQCRLNYLNRGGSYGGMDWSNDNEFVGKVNAKGLFKSRKAGKSNIYCTNRGNAYESGIQAYSIEVVPRDNKWFADRLIDDLKEHRTKQDFLVRNIKRKIISETPEKNIIRYVGLSTEGSSALYVQFDVLNTVQRCAVRLPSSPQVRIKIKENLEDRFDKIKFQKENKIQIWIHQVIDNEHEEVDVYAVLFEQKNDIILCLGQNWREFGEKEEFLDNIILAGRQFEDLVTMPLDETPIPIRDEKEEKTIPDKENEEKDILQEATENDINQEEKENTERETETEDDNEQQEGDVDFPMTDELSGFENYSEEMEGDLDQ